MLNVFEEGEQANVTVAITSTMRQLVRIFLTLAKK